MPFTTAEIARKLQGELIGDGNVLLTGFAPANTARPGDLTFAENETYLTKAEQSAAAAILVDDAYKSSQKVLIKVPNARIAFAHVLSFFYPEPAFLPGIHPTAIIAPSVSIDPSCCIGPYCVVGEHSVIGPRAVLQAHVFVGNQCQIGEDSVLYAHVSVYSKSQIGKRVRIHSGAVVGSDGFGYVLDQGVHLKVPQVGCVIIHDDVEIGANVTIDRGTLGPTCIGKGTKIDNLVQVGHNVVLGEHCILVAQVGVAGSTKVGNHVTLAGQAGIAGHLKIADRVIVGGQSGVMTDIPEGQKWLGSPARPDRQMKRQMIALEQLPDLIHRVTQLERMLEKYQSSNACEDKKFSK